MSTKSQILRKDTILSALVEVRQNILSKASTLSETEQNQVFLSIWTVKDLLAHLIGWDHTNLDAIQSVLSGELPSFYQHRDHDWQTYNARLVKTYKKSSFKELLASMSVSQERLVEFLETIPPGHFSKDFGVRFRGYKVTVQRLLEAETRDEQIHLQQITDFFKKAK